MRKYALAMLVAITVVVAANIILPWLGAGPSFTSYCAGWWSCAAFFAMIREVPMRGEPLAP